MKRNFPLHIHISTLFLLLIVLVGGLIGGFGYKVSRDMLESAATDLTQRISHETLRELQGVFAPAEVAFAAISNAAFSPTASPELTARSVSTIS